MAVSKHVLPSLASILTVLLFLVAVGSPAGVVVQIGQNFTGTTYGGSTTNSAAIPPDPNGAVGPNHFVEFINGMFCVYTKTNGHRVERITDLDFWANAGVGVDVADLWDVSDPRIIYDSTAQRWFASQVDVDELSEALDGTLTANHFLLAVSETADPTGPWNGVSFDADPVNSYFADFPTLGVDSQGVYLSGDMFDANNNPVGPSLVSFPKADLLANPPIFDNRTEFGVMSYSDRGQVLQPVTCWDGSSSGTVLATGDIGTDTSPHSNLVSFAVQNAAAPGAATLTPSTRITVSPYVVPFDPDVSAPMFAALQPDSTTALAANDARLSAKVYAVGGILYAVHNTEWNGRIAIRWHRINATNLVVLESGTITDPNLDLFFPSIAANTNGTVVIGCNGSGLATFVSCYAIVGQTTGHTTAFGNLILLQSGVVSYHGDDELLNGTPPSRWGDYSATSVDPSDPSRFWTIQMYPSDPVNSDVWSTQITELLTTPIAQLAIAPAGTNVLISWSPAFVTGYQLQSSSALGPAASWSGVPQPPSVSGNQASVLMSVFGKQQFFRLQKL